MTMPRKISGATSAVLALAVAFLLVGAGAAYGQVAELGNGRLSQGSR